MYAGKSSVRRERPNDIPLASDTPIPARQTKLPPPDDSRPRNFPLNNFSPPLMLHSAMSEGPPPPRGGLEGLDDRLKKTGMGVG